MRLALLCGWKHSGFNVHRSHRVPPGNREDIERLAQYIIRNPFSVDKMQLNSSGDEQTGGHRKKGLYVHFLDMA